MKDYAELIIQIEVQRKVVEEDRKSLSVKEADLAEMERTLIERVKGGVISTGDSIKDYVVSVLGLYQDKTEKAFRGITESVTANPGQLVMIIEQYEYNSFHGGPGDGRKMMCDATRFSIGKLVDESPAVEFILGNTKVNITTSGLHLYYDSRLGEKNVKVKGNIPIDLYRDLCPDSIILGGIKSRQILVGNKMVHDWFADYGHGAQVSFRLLLRAVHTLGVTLKGDDFSQFTRELESVRKNEVIELEILLGEIRTLKAEITQTGDQGQKDILAKQLSSKLTGMKNRIELAESYGLGKERTVREAKSILRVAEREVQT